MDVEGLSDIHTAADVSNRLPRTHELAPHAGNMFHPYPNASSFCIGDWYWNNGPHLSRESLHSLVSIIGSPDFRPADVTHTNWNKIDTQLGRNKFDEGADVNDLEWMDDNVKWMETPIRISIPFHSRANHPGPKDFLVGNLHYRSIISVLREKLANPDHDQEFHYEPFELLWQPTDEKS